MRKSGFIRIWGGEQIVNQMGYHNNCGISYDEDEFWLFIKRFYDAGLNVMIQHRFSGQVDESSVIIHLDVQRFQQR